MATHSKEIILLETYSNIWSEPDEIARKEVLANILAPDFIYTDPNIRTVGQDRLSDYMKEFQRNFAGARFVLTDIKIHHDQILTHWDMVNNEGSIFSKGASFGIQAGGQLRQMTGFFWDT